MIDPIAAMYAAVQAVGNGEAGEIELEWTEEKLNGDETRLTITIRKEVKHYTFGSDSDNSED